MTSSSLKSRFASDSFDTRPKRFYMEFYPHVLNKYLVSDKTTSQSGHCKQRITSFREKMRSELENYSPFGITKQKKNSGEEAETRLAIEPTPAVMEGCCQEAVPILGSQSTQGLNLDWAYLSVSGASPPEWSSRPAVWVTKTLRKRSGLRFCWSVLYQYMESHGGCNKLLTPFSEPCLGLSHPSLFQGLQYSQRTSSTSQGGKH